MKTSHKVLTLTKKLDFLPCSPFLLSLKSKAASSTYSTLFTSSLSSKSLGFFFFCQLQNHSSFTIHLSLFTAFSQGQSHKWPSMCTQWAVSWIRGVWRPTPSALSRVSRCSEKTKCFVLCWQCKCQGLTMFSGWFKVWVLLFEVLTSLPLRNRFKTTEVRHKTFFFFFFFFPNSHYKVLAN